MPKKLDNGGQYSTGTLPPDSYLLLEDHRRIADVVHDYVARGAENKLLLKRRRFDANGADFSKPQFIALTEVKAFLISIMIFNHALLKMSITSDIQQSNIANIKFLLLLRLDITDLPWKVKAIRCRKWKMPLCWQEICQADTDQLLWCQTDDYRTCHCSFHRVYYTLFCSVWLHSLAMWHKTWAKFWRVTYQNLEETDKIDCPE